MNYYLILQGERGPQGEAGQKGEMGERVRLDFLGGGGSSPLSRTPMNAPTVQILFYDTNVFF